MKLDIKRLGINGEGIGIQDNKVCFVSGALPGEKVEASIIAEKKNFMTCRLENIFEESKERVIPKCPYFGKCGGCDLQHMNKQMQVDFKKNKVADTLKKIAKIDVGVKDTIRLNDYRYRNKMVYPVVSCNGKARVGMFEGASHNIVEITQCQLCSEYINNLYTDIKMFIEQNNFVGYSIKNKSGDIKYVVIREYNGQALMTIVSNKHLQLKPLYDFLHSKYKHIGLSIIISDSDTEILSGQYKYVAGIESLEICEFGIKYRVDNRGFLQINNEIKTELYQRVLDCVSENDIVIDGYSGAGLLSASFAKKCKRVIGIEINKSASNSAKLLAKENNLNNMECITSDIKLCFEDVLKHIPSCVVVLDPARSGCDASVIDALTNENNLKKISKIIYISCNPATLARDLSGLKDYYNVTSITPFDMFPQTKHVETLVCLQRRV